MGGPRRPGVTGPLEEYEAGFVVLSGQQGYGRPAAGHQLALMVEVSGWLAAASLDVSGLTSAVAAEFVAERLVAGQHRYVTAAALAPLLGYLRDLGVAPPAEPAAEVGPVEELLARFGRYLRAERGLTSGTARGYIDAVRPFLVGRLRDGQLDLGGLSAGDVTRFVVASCPGRAPGPAKLIVSALRSLLGFLHVDGTLAVSLSSAVPSVAARRLAGLPRPLTASEVRALLEACDRRTTVGRRDYARGVLLSRLGLRSGEVARLALDDIDWRAGEIVVSGKGSRIERLPLPADVGEAVAGYLRRGRPASAQGRTVFVRVRAPHRGLSSGGVTQAVFAAGQRAGLGAVYAHRLRHSAATAMLAGGAPLAEIGQVLRHRRVLTTAIYAKVDVASLATIVRPWPTGAR
jgi:integrase/recombinase XerD